MRLNIMQNAKFIIAESESFESYRICIYNTYALKIHVCFNTKIIII